jgi:GH24 family phage-related lysozyme (muramidase)
MRTSSAGLAFIAHFEGEVNTVYHDVAGVATIGIGHALKPNESFPAGITHQQAIDLLTKDVVVAESAINRYVTVSLTQDQFDALVSFTFNLGTGALASSTLLKLLNAGNYQGAANEFPRWCKAVVNGRPVVNPGLLKRRNAERDMFLTGAMIASLPSPPNPTPAIPVEALAGDSQVDKIVGLVRCYIGCSLIDRRADLGHLVSRGIDNPERVVPISTNCATTALGIMVLAGVQHPLLKQPYELGKAVEWVVQVGNDLGAIVKCTGPFGARPQLGSLLRYNTSGKNDDHFEWLLGPINEAGVADHAGGGRPNNAISEEHSNIWTNNGRPLIEWIDPDRLLATPATPISLKVAVEQASTWQSILNVIKSLFS